MYAYLTSLSHYLTNHDNTNVTCKSQSNSVIGISHQHRIDITSTISNQNHTDIPSPSHHYQTNNMALSQPHNNNVASLSHRIIKTLSYINHNETIHSYFTSVSQRHHISIAYFHRYRIIRITTISYHYHTTDTPLAHHHHSNIESTKQ